MSLKLKAISEFHGWKLNNMISLFFINRCTIFNLTGSEIQVLFIKIVQYGANKFITVTFQECNRFPVRLLQGAFHRKYNHHPFYKVHEFLAVCVRIERRTFYQNIIIVLFEFVEVYQQIVLWKDF